MGFSPMDNSAYSTIWLKACVGRSHFTTYKQSNIELDAHIFAECMCKFEMKDSIQTVTIKFTVNSPNSSGDFFNSVKREGRRTLAKSRSMFFFVHFKHFQCNGSACLTLVSLFPLILCVT